MSKQSFSEILAERQEYLDKLKQHGDTYALGFLETSFLYHMDNSGLAPLTTAQHSTLKKWKEAKK